MHSFAIGMFYGFHFFMCIINRFCKRCKIGHANQFSRDGLGKNIGNHMNRFHGSLNHFA